MYSATLVHYLFQQYEYSVIFIYIEDWIKGFVYDEQG